MSQIYGFGGKPLVAVGGKDSYRQFKKGNVVCSLQWAGEPIEPAMCLFPHVPTSGAGVFVLCLSSLYKYVEKSGYASLALKTDGWRDIARHLGLDPLSRSVCADICGLIEDAAPDLVWMPPTPKEIEKKAEAPKVGEMQIREKGGRVVHEAEV